MHTAEKSDPFLTWALRANASFSIISVIAMLVAGGWIAPQIGLAGPSMLLPVAGSLVVFAGLLLWSARRGYPSTASVAAFAIGDVLWVVGSAEAVLAEPAGVTPLGYGLIIGVALVVGVFAVLQIYGLMRRRARRLSTAAHT